MTDLNYKTATGLDLAVLTLRAMGGGVTFECEYLGMLLWKPVYPLFWKTLQRPAIKNSAIGGNEGEALQNYIKGGSFPDLTLPENYTVLHDWARQRWFCVSSITRGDWHKADVATQNDTVNESGWGQDYNSPSAALCRAIIAAIQAERGEVSEGSASASSEGGAVAGGAS